jgi:2-polyprenyl-6-methoxyphenol hydroxylase-like FAD-dependent oxidoreductase
MSPSDNTPDAVIVGAGIALAISLARSGYSVALLEKSIAHVDRVRGEFIVPWGVAEAKALGILDVLENAGANDTVRSIPYGEWPADEQSIGVDGDLGFYIFPQGQGRIRLYATHGLDQRNRFAGEGAVERFLQAFDRPSLPHRDSLSRARPAGPCHGYPNNDVWIDNPVVPGVVLIGDAASHNDPSGGQGISIALKDARLVSEALEANKAWTPETFAPYASQRREQMRRLRFSARLLSTYRMEFTDQAKQQKGPFAVPSEAFSEHIWDRLLG